MQLSLPRQTFGTLATLTPVGSWAACLLREDDEDTGRGSLHGSHRSRYRELLQIGHQRRSNPRYLHAYHNLTKRAELMGRFTTANGQWNRSAKPFREVNPRIAVDQDVLEKNGFENMEQFLNWRWFRDSAVARFRPGISPNRHLQLVLRRPAQECYGQRWQRLLFGSPMVRTT